MTAITKESYSKQVVEHSKHPRNRGIMQNPDAVGIGGSPCGDETEFYLKIDTKKVNGKNVDYIKDIKFETMGCAAAVATASLVTEMIKGKTLKEALKLTRDEVVKKIGGLPLVKLHCCDLTINALRKTIQDWEDKNKTSS
jgi:nitrogen fixation NifU-like protein